MSDLLDKWWEQGQTIIENGLLTHYRILGLDSEELIFVIQLKSYLDQKQYFPSMSEIGDRMGVKESKVFAILHDLIQRNLVAINTEKDNTGKDFDRYSLTPLYRKLAHVLEKSTLQTSEVEKDINLLEIFQQEFGRLLTPIEMQTIGEWMDKDRYQTELILEALKEAVLNQKYSLRYIDRILMSWEKKNIRTSVQAKEETKRFSNYQERPPVTQPQQSSERIPLFNWLESEE